MILIMAIILLWQEEMELTLVGLQVMVMVMVMVNVMVMIGAVMEDNSVGMRIDGVDEDKDCGKREC